VRPSQRAVAAAAVTLAGLLAAGCASASPSRAPASPAASVPPVSAQTAQPYGTATWATLPMGGTGPNLFWQLFALPDGSTKWQLHTPPGIATNGAIVLAGQDGTTGRAAAPGLVAGVRPSLDLDFSPLIATSDEGRSWSALPPVPGLADVPDALAATSIGRLIALTGKQAVTTLAPAAASTAGDAAADSTGQATLTTKGKLAQAPGAAACQLTTLTAVSAGPDGTPLVGGACARPGVAGIFGYSSGTWRLAGPTLPASLATGDIRVLRLTTVGRTVAALLQAGTGESASLVAAWATAGQPPDGPMAWSVSPALALRGASVRSASFGGTGQGVAIALSTGGGAVLAGPRGTWQALPALPAGRAVVLALPVGRTVQALAADGGTLTVWQLSNAGGHDSTARAGHWAKVQVIGVPIQYGSSSSGSS